MLTNSHQVPAQSHAVPKARPSAAARQGVALPTRQASHAIAASCSGQSHVWT